MDRDTLLSRMIGLACACANNVPTDRTEGLLMAGLYALSPEAPLSDEQAERLVRRIEEDKRLVAPNCASCTSRCGRTDDYDMARWYASPEAVRREKDLILRGLISRVRARGFDPFVYDALRALAEDWEPETLHWYAERAGSEHDDEGSTDHG